MGISAGTTGHMCAHPNAAFLCMPDTYIYFKTVYCVAHGFAESFFI